MIAEPNRYREGVVVRGVGWEQVAPGVWNRYVVRHVTSTNTDEAVLLHRVMPTLPVCMACLSHRVLFADAGLQRRYRCRDCGVVTWIEDPQ